MEDSRRSGSFYLPGPGETNIGPVSDREPLSLMRFLKTAVPKAHGDTQGCPLNAARVN